MARKIALVAGSTRGAGRGIACMLGEAGATVYCTGRSTRGKPSTKGRPETTDETAEMVTARGGTGIAGAAALLLSRTTHASLAVLSTTLLGIGVAIFLVPAYALFQEETPQELLGRVTSLALAVLSVAQVIGMGIAGAAALQLAPPALIFVIGCELCAASAVFLVFHAQVSRARR